MFSIETKINFDENQKKVTKTIDAKIGAYFEVNEKYGINKIKLAISSGYTGYGDIYTLTES